MIIDAHAHVRGAVFPGDKRDAAAGLVKTMQEAGIDQSVILGIRADAGDQSALFDAAAAYPDRFLPFILVTPDFDNPGQIVDQSVSQHSNVYGIGEIYPGFGPAELPLDYMMPVIEAAQKHHLPVLFHTGDFSYTAPIMLTEIIRSFPHIDFILGHMGSIHFVLDTIEMVKTFPNVYTDTSGMTSPAMLLRAIQECGSHKILFGSDYPFWHPSVELARIEALKLDKQSLNNVLGDNISRLLNK